MQTNEAIKLWQELGITSCTMDFSCGGDSMNDYSFTFYKPNDKKGKNQPAQIEIEVECSELENYFDKEVFNNVDFYETSDGHYQGEFGKVHIKLVDEDDDHYFSYSKNAQSEWSERYSEVIGITLSDKEKEILKEFVNNINGSGDEGARFNYKKDFIVTDDIQETLNDLGNRIAEECGEFEFEDVEGERTEWYAFTTDYDNNETNDLIIVGNTLKIQTSQSYDVVRDSID